MEICIKVSCFAWDGAAKTDNDTRPSARLADVHDMAFRAQVVIEVVLTDL